MPCLATPICRFFCRFGLDTFVRAENQSSAAIDDFVATSHFEADLAATRGIRDKIGAHLEIVFAENPGKSVSKCHQVLVQGTICIPPAVLERRKSAAEIDGGVTERLQFRSAHDCSIGVDIGLIETDAGKKTLQGGVAVAAQFLEIETSTRFVHQVIPQNRREL